MNHRATGEAAPPLPPDERARGRRLAFTSHPLGMTFSMVFSQHLPTLALVSLGASESVVGLQNALGSVFQPLQLPTLRAVGRVAKRRILILGQAFAVLGALPLVAFASLEQAGDAAVPLAMASFAAVTAGLTISNTVWFPLLRAYVEPNAIGRFFGLLRSGWHLALIVYYVAAQRWLAANPGAFGELFLAGWVCGLLRIALISRLPERSERTGERIRVGEALALVRENRDFRRYLEGVTASAAVRLCVVPFAIVMLRREIGLTDGQILLTTIASFAGGLASLYLWGTVVDRIGPAPVFRWTSIGMALLYLLLLDMSEPSLTTVVTAVVFFFGFSVLASGFGVADTHVLFGMTPPEAPARVLVVASVVVHLAAGIAPVSAGFALERWLAAADDPLSVYRTFFAALAVLQAVSFLPLRRFGR